MTPRPNVPRRCRPRSAPRTPPSSRRCSSTRPPYHGLPGRSRQKAMQKCSSRRLLCRFRPRSRRRSRPGPTSTIRSGTRTAAARISPALCTLIRPPRDRRDDQSAATPPRTAPGKTRERPERRRERRIARARDRNARRCTMEARPGRCPPRNSPPTKTRRSNAAAGLVRIRRNLLGERTGTGGAESSGSSIDHRSRPRASVRTRGPVRPGQKPSNPAYTMPANPRTQNGDRQPRRSPKITRQDRPSGRSQIHARLMDAQRPRSRPRSMIIRQERHRRREVKRLPQPLGPTKEDQLEKLRDSAVAAQIKLQNARPSVIKSRRGSRSTV